MIFRFEKIIMVLLIVVFGLIPAFAFLMLSNTSAINANIQAGFQDLSFFEQSAAVATAFLVKPIYTILALLIFIFLWKRIEPELKALKWSMIFFFIGENFCAANFLFTENHDIYLFEYFHSLGMVLSFGFASFALIEGIDRYVIHFAEPDKNCSLTPFCRRCIKYEPVACGLQSFLIFVSIVCALVALMPLSSELHLVSYNSRIWGTAYNYNHPIIYQFFEFRYFPLLASVLFLAAALILRFGRHNRLHLSKMIFAAALGVFGFSLFRFIVFQGYRTNLVWMDFWEEVTEFIFILGVISILWFFRRPLFKREAESNAADPA
ncbi:MAG: hypothetical protein KJP06_01500 [Deltaproteobacteria bacterium]|nr:hypothetical protein [Deltaproteobacteria bacterium]